jgi:hypothetical protein
MAEIEHGTALGLAPRDREQIVNVAFERQGTQVPRLLVAPTVVGHDVKVL